MTETSQAKLLDDANDLQALLKRVGKARDVMRGIEAERATAGGRLAKLRDERTALQLKLATLEGDSKTIETQIAKLDEAIVGLRALLQAVYDGGLVAKPAVVKSQKPQASAAPAAATNGARATFGEAEQRRVEIIEACARTPMTMPELREKFPHITVENLRPIVSLMVQSGRLKRSGTYGKYVYAASASAVKANGAKANGAAKPNGALPAPPVAKPGGTNENNVRAYVLSACLSEPKTPRQLRLMLPKVNERTVRSALVGLFAEGKLSRIKVKGQRGGTYGAPAMLAKVPTTVAGAEKPVEKESPAPRGAHIERVLATCKTPMTFGALALRLKDINTHVLHQSVYALVRSKRLLRSGKRGMYVYKTA